MDSPTLFTFNYQQFYQENRPRVFEFNFNEPVLSAAPSVCSIDVKNEEISSQTSTTSQTSPASQPRRRNRASKVAATTASEDYKATKNLAKNYGKAITSFASSSLATPYLQPILQREGLDSEDFYNYMKSAKDSIQGIDSFRAFLLVNSNDDAKLVAQKRAFQAMGIVFIKYFSVNWIMHGRINNKIVYLKNRFKILRRIQNPEVFTYLQGPKPKKEGKSPNKAK